MYAFYFIIYLRN